MDNSRNDDQFYLSSPKTGFLDKRAFNLKELIRNHAVKLLWGRGYTLHGKDRKLIEKVLENSHAETFFPVMENLKFEHGHVIITIRKTKSGEVFLTVPILFGTSNVAKVFEEEELAVTWERFVYDDTNYVMRSEFTPTKTTISFHHDEGNGVMGEAVTLGLSAKIRKKFNLPAVENHNLGIVPVSFLPNLPQKNFFGTVIGEWYPDTRPSRDDLEEVQNHIHEIIDCINWELQFNRTTAHISLSPMTIEQLKKNPSEIKNIWNKMMVYNKALDNSVLGPGEGGKSLVQLLQGKPQLDILAMYLDYTIDRGFNICGYNSPQGTREHGTNKTSSEIDINMQNDFNTTCLKKTISERQINRLFKKILAVLGKPEGDCRIEIHGMSTLEAGKQFDRVIAALQAGAIDRASALSKLWRIPLEEAEEMAKKIEGEEKVKAEREASQSNSQTGQKPNPQKKGVGNG